MKTRLNALLLAAALCAGAGAAQAQDAAAMSPAMIEQLNLAHKLIALGEARKDPVLLLAAAALQKGLALEDGATLPAKALAADEVLARARSYAVGRPELISIADELGAPQAKGQWRIDAVTGRSSYRR